MFNSNFRQWLRSAQMNRPSSARCRKTRGTSASLDRPAEVLEDRALLTATGIPYFVFSVQPGNTVAGHSLKFTAEAMINVKTDEGTVAEVDTAFNGTCWFTPILAGKLGTFDTPYNFAGPQGPNTAIGSVNVPVVNGIAGDHPKRTSIDLAGNYLIEAAVTEFSPGSGLFVINSNPFTVTAFTATDHLVFLKAPSETTVGATFSATVAAEDEYGNIDTGENNVPVTLYALPGNTVTGELKNGEATFNDAYFVAEGGDALLAVASEPGGGTLVGADFVEVFGSNGNAS
jgi:hypothetical protein